MANNNDDDDLDGLLDEALDDLESVDKKHTIPTRPIQLPTPTTTSTTSTTTTTTTTTSTTNTTSTPQNADKPEEELAEQFAKQMADLLSTLQTGDLEKNIEEMVNKMGGLQLPEESGSSSSSTNENNANREPTEEEQADLAKMISALAALDTPGEASSSSSDSTASNITDKLKKIAEHAKNIKDDEAGGEDLEKMLKDFEENPEFQSVMEGMVNQMISKDVLYEPMKELREKYPKWLEDNRATLSDDDYRKYIEQYNIVQKICTVYEGSPENATPEQMQEVVQLMQDMAEYGQPPADIIKELAPGVQIGPDGVPVFPGVDGGDPANPLAAGCSIM